MLSLWINTLINCIDEKEQLSYPSHYQITLKNNYFETLDSVWFDHNHMGALEPNMALIFPSVEKGEHNLRYISKSQIEFKTVFELKSQKNSLIVTINKNGKLNLE